MSKVWKIIIVVSLVLNILLIVLYLNALGQIRKDTSIMTDMLLNQK